MPVSVVDLRRLTGTSKTDSELQLFCDMGQIIVDEFLSSEPLANSIALYLAGHFYVISIEGGGITYSKSGQAEEKYKSFGFDTIGFATTRFGSMAVAMDTSNKLMELSMKDRVAFDVESYTNSKANDRLADDENITG